ncbi:hypothetical protein VNO77_41759 [Canavalia gladiata]|uniref:Uncharacterized protein n=1 Tax=Canavalia gladiata TaxID=3824 RepID=A0AAN9PS95_CANGL
MQCVLSYLFCTHDDTEHKGEMITTEKISCTFIAVAGNQESTATASFRGRQINISVASPTSLCILLWNAEAEA